jgi:hypothetical protein
VLRPTKFAGAAKVREADATRAAEVMNECILNEGHSEREEGMNVLEQARPEEATAGWVEKENGRLMSRYLDTKSA